MKKLVWLVVACFAAVLVQAGDEEAAKCDVQGKGKCGPGMGNPEHHKKMLEKFDADKDGKLSDSEKAAAKAEFEKKRAGMEAKALEKFDADKDGKLSDEERAVMKKERAEMHGKMKAKKDAILKKYDKDADGKLNDEEKEAGKEEIKAMHEEMEAMGGPGKGRGLMGKKGEGCKDSKEGDEKK